MQAQVEAGQMQISVTDSGHGIFEENIQQIFEPLFTTKAQGIGLGLAVSKNLIEANGGNITATSIPEERTTFNILLPTTDMALQET